MKLYAKDLDVTREFDPKHAEALLAYQKSKGYAHWQPATEVDPTIESK